jgi:hypothetical protein
MFQFGEILTLAICGVTVAYLIANWRRIRSLPALAPYLGPFLCLLTAWITTVAEGLFLSGEQLPLVVFAQESILVATQSPFSELLNFVEHAAYAAAGIWLLILIVRDSWNRAEAPA